MPHTPVPARPKFVSLLREKIRTAVDAPPNSFRLVAVQPSKPNMTEPSKPNMKEAELDASATRRAQIYALNNLLRERSTSEWKAYQKIRRRRMVALECCLDHLVPRLEGVGLKRWAERCVWVQEDERQEAVLRVARSEATLSHCISITATSEDDEMIIRAMPVDELCGPQRTRHCPWYSTAAGCPRLSSCPLSHRVLPRELVTWNYRRWALEMHDGWCGEPVNQIYARVHAL